MTAISAVTDSCRCTMTMSCIVKLKMYKLIHYRNGRQDSMVLCFVKIFSSEYHNKGSVQLYLISLTQYSVLSINQNHQTARTEGFSVRRFMAL